MNNFFLETWEIYFYYIRPLKRKKKKKFFIPVTVASSLKMDPSWAEASTSLLVKKGGDITSAGTASAEEKNANKYYFLTPSSVLFLLTWPARAA